MIETLSIDRLQQDDQAAYNHRERRHPQWTDNYHLYRDTVITNRLTQRQSVNVPLVKEALRTQIAKVDDFPQLHFESKDNNEEKEIYLNTYWEDLVRKSHLELLDIIDKKQVMLYGRSFRMLNIVDGRIVVEAVDPMDILIDRYANPWDIESAQFITHTGIFTTLDSIERNAYYDAEAIKALKVFFATRDGFVKSEENAALAADKNARMSEMGVPDAENPLLGHTVVEIKRTIRKMWDSEKKKLVPVVITRAEDQIVMQKPLEDILGIDFQPYITWADDIERTDIWSDGIADIARVPNQILNVWLSQLVENRTLRNFGMHYYNSDIEDFMPQMFEPSPWGWYPVPAGQDGDIRKVMSRVEIPDLSESLDEMKFVIDMARSSTASTATESGVSEQGAKTLGEIEILAARAQERITSMTKYSNLAAKELGDKCAKLAQANADVLEPITLYKKGPSGKYYERELKLSAIKSRSGYNCTVTTVAEKQREDIENIQKLNVAKASFPTNIPLQRIVKEKMLDFVGLTSDQAKEVMDYEEQQQAQLGAGAPPGTVPGLPPTGPAGPASPAAPNVRQPAYV